MRLTIRMSSTLLNRIFQKLFTSMHGKHLYINPLATLKGALRYWQAFFSFQWYGAFGYIVGSTSQESLVGRSVMALLSIVGLLTAIRRRTSAEHSMILAGIIGIFLSVPFVPPLDAEIRTYAASNTVVYWYRNVRDNEILSLIFQKEKIGLKENEKMAKIPAWTLCFI